MRTGSVIGIGYLLACGYLQPLYAADNIIDEHGCVIESVFEQDWRIQSTFNPAREDKSWPVQQFEDTRKEITKINEEIAAISAYMVLDSEARQDARTMEQALVRLLKANLLRSFWRLAWITYNTIGGPTGKTGMISTGRAYAGLFTEGVSVASTAKMLGIVKKLVPKQYSKLHGRKGRVVNVGVDALLAALQNSGKSRTQLVASVVTSILKTGSDEALKANTISPDISPEDIAILRSQYIGKNQIKDAIAESERLNAEREARIAELEAQERSALDKARDLELAEKQRTYSEINKNCRKAPDLKFSLFAPTRVIKGEVVDVFVRLPPGRKASDFVYAWSDEKDLLLKNSVSAKFQSIRTGPHRISVQFIDSNDRRSLGMLSTTIEVVDPQATVTKPAAASGPVRVKVSRFTIKPTQLKPGDIVEFEIAYSVSGLVQGKKTPVTIRYTGSGSGQSFDKSSRGEIVNGTFTGWYKLPTTGWKPGRYSMQTTVAVPGSTDSAGGEFIIRQPDVAAVTPPAPVKPSGTARAEDFIGDWSGTGTVTNVNGFDGWRRGSRMPVKVRITYEGGAYRVYDLLDTDIPTTPMHSKVTGNSVVFYYRGPAVDTQGYKHPEQPIDVSWSLTRSGNSMSGNFHLVMEDGNVTIYVNAKRTP